MTASQVELPAFEARYSIPRLSLYLIIAGGTGAMAAYLLAAGFEDGLALLVAVAAFALAASGIATLAIMRCLFDRRVQVYIDEHGLLVRAHSDTAIPLRSLTGVSERGSRLIFGLTKPGKYPIENSWRRFIYRVNGSQAGAFFGNLWIWTVLLDCTARDVLNALHDFRIPTEFEQEMRARGGAAKTDLVPYRL